MFRERRRRHNHIRINEMQRTRNQKFLLPKSVAGDVASSLRRHHRHELWKKEEASVRTDGRGPEPWPNQSYAGI
jgi:hypothetical protein